MSDELKHNQEQGSSETENKEESAAAEEAGQEEQYSFLQETFKDEQKNKKNMHGSIWKTAGRGILFGAAACLAFCALKPFIESRIGNNPDVVTIPADDTAEEDKAKEEGEDGAEEEAPVLPSLTVDSYREMNRELYQIAVASSKAVVEVTGIQEGNWEDTNFDEKNSVSGVIFYDNGIELLMLAPSRIIKDAQGFTVTFTDNTSYSATIKKQDRNLGLAVFSVVRNKVSESTWAQIQVATLGNSNIVNRGDPMIALGKQFGYVGGLGYGTVSSVRNKVAVADGEYKLLTTDIAAAENGSGILFNTNGEVIGIADQKISDGPSNALVTAYAISDIKDCLELLSNGKAVPYLGIKGVEVTENIAQEQGLPEGIYVKEVEADSPAMQAGIQSGDVITKIGKTTVTTLSGYRKSLLDCTSGQPLKVNGQRQGASGYVEISFDVTVGSKE